MGGVARSTDGGVSFSNRNSGNGLGHNQAYSLALDSSGNLYAATYGGLSISTDNGNSYTNRTTANGLGHNYVTVVKVDSDDRIYAQTPYAATMNYSDNGGANFTQVNISNGWPVSTFKDIDKLASGKTFLLAGDIGTFSSSNNFSDYKMYFDKYIFNQPEVLSIKSRNNIIYVGHNNGLSLSYDNGKTFVLRNNLNSGIESGDVYNVEFRNDNDLVVVSRTGGSYSRNGGFYFEDANLPFGSYTSMEMDSLNNVFFGSYNGIVATTFGSTVNNTRTTADGLGSNFVVSLFIDNSDILYACTLSGVSISTDNGVSFTNKTTTDGLPINTCSNINGNSTHIFIATSSGLAISNDNGNSFITKTVADGLLSNNIIKIFVIDEDVYLSSPEGVVKSTDNGQSFALFSDDTMGLGASTVLSLGKLSNNDLFIGNNSGLYIKR